MEIITLIIQYISSVVNPECAIQCMANVGVTTDDILGNRSEPDTSVTLYKA